jgi:hypothetical protein
MGLRQRFPRYSKLFRFYPEAYRKRYDEQMLQTLADMLDDREASTISTWARTAVDLPASIIKQQLRACSRSRFRCQNCPF